MLVELTIRDIAIIDRLQLSFSDGFTVLTGETGAGKSIIVDAVELLIGGRGSVDLIRSGADEGVVEGLFDLRDAPATRELLREGGYDGGDELHLRRVISRSGRSRCHLDGSSVTLAMLARIGRSLINIYGQHESQTLLQRERHRELLDRYAALDLSTYRGLYDTWRELCRRITALEEGARENARRLDLLTFQRDELVAASLQPGEDERLRREREILRSSEKLLRAGEEGYRFLSGDDDSILGRLASVTRLVADAARIDPSLSPILATLEGVSPQLDDAARELAAYASRLELDPRRIDEVEERLHLIDRLSRKYGETVDEMLAFLARVEEEISHIGGGGERLEELCRERSRLEGEIVREGERIGRIRREAAGRLSAALSAEFADLAMPSAQLSVSFSPLPEPGPDGLEDVEFLFAPNPGEGAKPLSRIASGGELSRIMLALKQILPDREVPTLIFDEVDSGIGGATAAMVGRKLAAVARQQQVLCITHLPTVASAATHHRKVSKRTEGGRTTTVVTELTGSSRVEEIARMLGGVEVTDTTRAHAREMLREDSLPEKEGVRT